jgi:dTDP-4-dehydrorhamnose 3,5-epimerase
MSAARIAGIAASPAFRIEVPKCDKGLGDLISSPDSPKLIQGVRIRQVPLWPDDRGYFMEVFRAGEGLVADFPRDSTQVSAAITYPGVIKAFHYHLRQSDCWHPTTGMLQVALVDFRPESPTFGRRNTFYAGVLRPWQILIPPGVGHGYKVIGIEPALLVYATSRFYDPSDEGRVPYDDPRISYDWELQNK